MSEHVSTQWPTYLDPTALLTALDGIAEVRGAGVVLVDQGEVRHLRQPGPDGSSIIYERRRSGSSDLDASSGSRTAASSAPSEWLSFGFNCGGAVLSWVGVVGTGALAPVTGGLSAVGTGLLWGGALGASGACAASTYRVINVYRGRTEINDSLDKNKIYVWSMRGADVIGLLGAGGAIKELGKTGEILGKETLTWTRAANEGLSRPMRKRLTEQLELQGAKRVSATNINKVVKQRMLDALAGAIGMAGSAMTGVVHEVIVWIASPQEAKQ